jgi:hypothetical protein
MSNYHRPAPEGKDPELWDLAQRRASFKSHLLTYLIVNAFLWGIWYFSMPHQNDLRHSYPWPIWPTLGWGIGLAFHYVGAYVFPKSNSVENEYEKLKNSKNL